MQINKAEVYTELFKKTLDKRQNKTSLHTIELL